MGNIHYKKEKEATRMVIEVNKIGKEELLGKISRGKNNEKTVVTGMIYNLECWTEIEDSMIVT